MKGGQKIISLWDTTIGSLWNDRLYLLQVLMQASIIP